MPREITCKQLPCDTDNAAYIYAVIITSWHGNFPRYWSFVRGIHHWWPTMDSPNIEPAVRNFDTCSAVSLGRVLNKKSRCWWFETFLRRQYSGAYYDICTGIFCVHDFVDSCELHSYILPACFVGTGTLALPRRGAIQLLSQCRWVIMLDIDKHEPSRQNTAKRKPCAYFLAATKQLYEWYFLSVCHTFFTMFPSSYHHEIIRSYHQGPG